MSNKLLGIATLFAASSILVAGTPTLGARPVDPYPAARADAGGDDFDPSPGGSLRCGKRRCGGGHRCGGHRRCGGGHRCGGGRHCGGRQCAGRTCAAGYCTAGRCVGSTTPPA